MDKKTALKAAAASAVLAGTLVVAAPAAMADSCPVGQEMTAWGCGTVEDHPEQNESRGISTISSVKPSVGVDFRDANGNRTASGLSSRDQFKWLGETMPGNGTDGPLIKVEQISKNSGGWGPLYIGWIPVKYTQAPSLFQ